MILSLQTVDMDLSSVFFVGSVKGDKSWLRYSVVFDSGHTIEIYHEPKTGSNHMKREEFVEAWKRARGRRDS